MRRREVVALGEIVGDVIQLPHVVVERRVGVEPVVVHVPERLERHRLPSVVIDAAAAEHLEVLRARGARRPSGSSIRYAKLVPSIGDAATPPTESGGAIPTSSSTVGVTSMACAN